MALFLFLESEFCVAQAGLEPTMYYVAEDNFERLLSPPYWDYKHGLPQAAYVVLDQTQGSWVC